MGSAYIIRKEERLFLEVWVGEVLPDELIAHAVKVLSDPDFPSAPRVIVDITGATFEAVGEKEFDALFHLYREHRDKTAGAKVAMIAAKDFQKARLYEKKVQRASVNVVVFNDLDPACTWLGIGKKAVQEWIALERATLLSSPGA